MDGLAPEQERSACVTLDQLGRLLWRARQHDALTVVGNVLHQGDQCIGAGPTVGAGDHDGPEALALERAPDRERRHDFRRRHHDIRSVVAKPPRRAAGTAGGLEPKPGAPQQRGGQPAPLLELGLGAEHQRRPRGGSPAEAAHQPGERGPTVGRARRGHNREIVSPSGGGHGVPHSRVVAGPAQRGQCLADGLGQM